MTNQMIVNHIKLFDFSLKKPKLLHLVSIFFNLTSKLWSLYYYHLTRYIYYETHYSAGSCILYFPCYSPVQKLYRCSKNTHAIVLQTEHIAFIRMYVSGKTVLSRSGLWKVHVACWAGGQDKVYVTARHGISRTRLCCASIVGRRTEHGTVNGTYYTLHACPWFALLYSLMTCHAYETRIISTHTYIALTPWSRRISESELDRRA